MSLEVIYADAAMVLLNKPSGLLAVPGKSSNDCLSLRVQQRFADALIVHRLDMSTSGLMLMARGMAAQRLLNAAFAERRVHKRYRAVVHGRAIRRCRTRIPRGCRADGAPAGYRPVRASRRRSGWSR